MNKKKLRIYFTDFWPNFNNNDNYFYNLLSKRYEIDLDQNNPEILFHSVDYSGQENHKQYNNGITKKIFFTGENIMPNFEETDYSFSFNPDLGDKNYRLPLWVIFINWFNSNTDPLRDPSYLMSLDKLLKNKNKKSNFKPFFCSFIASKPVGKRMEFVPRLNEVKKIHSLGRLYSNSYLKIKGRGDHKKKLNYMKLFKFNIAFENSIGNGYVTEKILHSFYSNSIPIYWGDKKVKDDFNSNAFLNYDDFKNEDLLIEEVIKINNNKSHYLNYLNEPIFKNNKVPEFCLPENVLDFITKIIEK